jgi:hypothetical protein
MNLCKQPDDPLLRRRFNSCISYDFIPFDFLIFLYHRLAQLSIASMIVYRMQYSIYILVLIFKQLVQLVLISIEVFFSVKNRSLLILIRDEIDFLLDFSNSSLALSVYFHNLLDT